MDIPLRNSQVASFKLVDGDDRAVMVQFSKDAFGHMRVEAWSPGKTRLFAVDVSPDYVVTVDHVEGPPVAMTC
jgi:hypothetical protein